MGGNLLEEIAEEEATEADMEEERDLRTRSRFAALTVTSPDGGADALAGGAQAGKLGPTSSALMPHSSADDFLMADGGGPNGMDGGGLGQETDAIEPDQNLSQFLSESKI